MIMPQMSGGRVFEGLKAIDPGVRVLLSSGYSINGQAMDILAPGLPGFHPEAFHHQGAGIQAPRGVWTPDHFG